MQIVPEDNKIVGEGIFLLLEVFQLIKNGRIKLFGNPKCNLIINDCSGSKKRQPDISPPKSHTKSMKQSYQNIPI